jgi:hypothetical protein
MGERPAVPERTVATGAAATRESAAPEPPTVRLPERKRRRPWALAAIGGAVAVAIAAAAIALGGGGNSDPPAAANGNRPGQGDARVTSARSKPQTLSEPELIAKADAICAESQQRYLEIRDLESELYTADVPYAEALVRFARKRVQSLRRLRPPPQLEDAYREYVQAQERVYATDRQALAAARQDDVAGIEAARQRRDDEDGLRQGLSREIGFDVCSAGQG